MNATGPRVLRIATQNIQWGGDPLPGGDGQSRVPALLPYLARLDADVLVVTEFKAGERGDELSSSLRAAEYPHLLYGAQPPRSLGTAVASRVPITEVALPCTPLQESWRCVAVELHGITVVGAYFPLGDAKRPYWEWMLTNASALRDQDAILVGDFNTGKQGVDEAGCTFTSSDQQQALEDLGYVDCWRAGYPDGRDYTWYSSANNGFRLDYIWASPSLALLVTSVRHDHAAREARATDHSAVIAELDLGRRATLAAGA